MSLYYNPGKVDVEEAERSILAAGGGKKIIPKSGYDHIVLYSRAENRHLSYNLFPDGHIEDVHTDKGPGAFYTYGGAQ